MDRLTLAVIAAQQPLACVIDKDGDEWCAECLDRHLGHRMLDLQERWLRGSRIAGAAPHDRICFWCHAVAEVYRDGEPA